MKTDIYQTVTDAMIAALEAGTAPWVKPWDSTTGSAMPHNGITGRNYNGINVLVLMLAQHKGGYGSNGWVTYNQAANAGGNVRRGEKGTHVVFWNFLEKEKDGKLERIPMAKPFTVFNVEQCENLPVKVWEAPTLSDDVADALVQAAGVKVVIGGNAACYIPAQDMVRMPPREAFKSLDGYRSTLLHEATHWTGHKSRLDRDFTGRFGTEAYAVEELIAELGAAFLCARLGVNQDGGLRHNADYIGEWLKVLKQDKRAIFTASSAAQKASTFLMPEATEA